jgi:hypothetical protein
MFGKSRTLALAVATAGLIGMSATMASAATGPGGGDFGGLLNVSHNQIPIQLCNDTVPVNVLGVQVPIQNLVAALGLGNPGDTVALSNSSCHQGTLQADNNGGDEQRCGDCDQGTMGYRSPGMTGYRSTSVTSYPRTRLMSAVAGGDGPYVRDDQDGPGGGDFGGLVNLSHNQIPIQLCNDTVPVNVLGVQVPLQNITAALGLLSPGNTISAQDTSCHQGTAQADNNG